MATGELLDKKLREIRTKREVLLQPAPNYESYKTMLERGFLVRYNYESTAIEGNPLTQIEHDGILNRDQCPNTDRMRSVYEAINHADAFCYVNQHAIEPVSYTHLDVYKRQEPSLTMSEEVLTFRPRQEPAILLPAGKV